MDEFQTSCVVYGPSFGRSAVVQMKPSSSSEASEYDPVGSLNCKDLYNMHLIEHYRCLVG
jgi:hypothetical protein